MDIQTKRVYEPPADEDGVRVLVDRVWPRGRKKEAVKIDHWLKSVSPSAGLRKWFAHDPDRWKDFKKQYFEELREKRDALHDLLDEVGSDGVLTLVFGARDEQHNNAVALREYLRRMKRGR